ncbi:MAG: hypothetical protein Q8Q85_09765 [Gemmatimonadales bacterium]|nr:hypothetical protein [Gemmatimonadales bacterium]
MYGTDLGVVRQRDVSKWTEKGIDTRRKIIMQMAQRARRLADAAQQNDHQGHRQAMLAVAKMLHDEAGRLGKIDQRNRGGLDRRNRRGNYSGDYSDLDVYGDMDTYGDDLGGMWPAGISVTPVLLAAGAGFALATLLAQKRKM